VRAYQKDGTDIETGNGALLYVDSDGLVAQNALEAPVPGSGAHLDDMCLLAACHTTLILRSWPSACLFWRYVMEAVETMPPWMQTSHMRGLRVHRWQCHCDTAGACERVGRALAHAHIDISAGRPARLQASQAVNLTRVSLLAGHV